MKLLLDTHTFIWWDNEPEKLSQKVNDFLLDNTNEIILSVVSVWEMQIKIQLGKFKLKLPLQEIIESQQKTNNIYILPIELKHVLALGNLPTHHRDPFDRLLVTQSNIEDAYLVSKDPIFANYPVKVLW